MKMKRSRKSEESSEPRYWEVYVDRIPPLTSERVIRDSFSTFGKIHSVKVGSNYAYVEFCSWASAKDAIKAKNLKVRGGRVRVQWPR